MQQTTYQSLLTQILIYINYPNNKDKFVEEFELLNRIDAIASVIDAYPKKLQERIKTCHNTTELEKFIPIDAYKEAYISISQKALQEFVAAVIPVVSHEQKKKISQLFLQ